MEVWLSERRTRALFDDPLPNIRSLMEDDGASGTTDTTQIGPMETVTALQLVSCNSSADQISRDDALPSQASLMS